MSLQGKARFLSAPQKEALWILGIVLTVGSVYLYTLLPGVGYSGDSAKFQFVGAVLGTPHATGYPLYMMLGYLFAKVFPLGTLAYKANLLSALASLGCLVAIYSLCRGLRVSRLNAAAAVIIFAITPLYWGQSIVAEVYTLHAMLMAIVMLLLTRWSMGGSDRWLLFGLGIYALSFGHHMSSILLLPAMVWLIGSTNWRVILRPRVMGLTLLSITLSALQYAYLLWRYYDPNTRYLEVAVPDLDMLIWTLRGATFQQRMFGFSLAELLHDRIPMFAGLAIAQYGLLLLLIAYGVWRLRPLRINLFLLLYLATNTIWSLNYNIFDIDVYFIPGFLVMAVYLAVGLNAIQASLPAQLPKAVWPLLLLLPLILASGRIDEVSQRNNTGVQVEVESVLETIDADAVIVSPGYNFSEYFWYYLIGLDLQRTHNLYLRHQLNVDSIRAYIEDDVPLDRMPDRKPVPPGLSVYFFLPALNDPDRAEAERRIDLLEQGGLLLEPHEDRVYMVHGSQP